VKVVNRESVVWQCDAYHIKANDPKKA